MGLINAIGYGLAQGSAGVVEDLNTQIKSDIERNRAETLMQAKQEMDDRHAQAIADRVKAKAGGLIQQAQVDNVNQLYGPDSKLTRDDIADEEFSANPISEKQKRLLTLQAASESGAIPIGAHEKLMLDEDRADRQERAAAVKASYDERRLELEARKADDRDRRTDLMDRKLLAAIGGSKSGDLPSDAKMSEWLVKQGVYPDTKTAFEHVKQGKDKDDVAIQASIFAKIKGDSPDADVKEAWTNAGNLVKQSRAQEQGRTPQKGDASPYADGTELTGKDGKPYIVRNGVPVLKVAEEGGSGQSGARNR